MNYVVQKAKIVPQLKADWNDSNWSHTKELELKNFRPEGSDHRPYTEARLLYDAAGIHGIFRVEDRYVRCIRTHYHDEVWKDSCVEFFAKPRPDKGYFNFEFNCGGAFLCSYIVNPERTADGFKEFTKVPVSIGQTIQARSSLPPRVEPEIKDSTEWTLRFFIPFTLFEHYLGALGIIEGQIWRGNFYKCADECSHPHWGSWAPVEKFDFHQPSCFGEIRFE